MLLLLAALEVGGAFRRRTGAEKPLKGEPWIRLGRHGLVG